jgi:hypothetical protein
MPKCRRKTVVGLAKSRKERRRPSETPLAERMQQLAMVCLALAKVLETPCPTPQEDGPMDCAGELDCFGVKSCLRQDESKEIDRMKV